MVIEKNDRYILDTFYIVKGNHGALLGFDTANKLGVIHVVNTVEDREKKYPGLFTGIGKLKNCTVKLHIDKSVKPLAQRQRRTPFYLRAKVEQELDKLLKEDIIEKEEREPTPWISPIVTPLKKNTDEIRLCIDMREANKAIQRERHLLPTIDELINDLNGSTVYSKLDLRAGYHQLVLDPESRYITAFNTHVGVFRYKRLNFGICSASEIFQNTIRNVIQGIHGSKNISDDIIIYGKTQTEHDKALEQVFQQIHENGLTLNEKKCEYNKKSITFFGVVFSGEGISADPKKVKAIQEMTLPQNVSELKSFLGMTSYCSRFIRNYANITEPLRKLTKKDAEWKWDKSEQNAFEMLQKELSSETVMCFYDPREETQIMTDASPVGLSAIMTQNDKIVAYASRALTDTESRYSQTEREALAVVWACEHFEIYLRGAPHFTVFSDHKPLEKIWQKPRPPLRIERWGLRLQPYKMTVKYKPGKDNPSDYMSRHPNNSENEKPKLNAAEEYVRFIAESAVLNAMTLDEVKLATTQDKTMMKAIEYTKYGKWHNIKTIENPEISLEELTSLRSVKDELTVHGKTILLRDRRIVLPASLRQRAIHIAHEGHQGTTRTKAFLRSKVWFPNMNEMVKDIVKGCIACLATTKERNRNEPLKMSELPSGPWQNLSADFCRPLPSGEYLFVITDEYSRYPIVEIVKSVSANRVIPVLDKTFAEFGIVKTIKTDNGSSFNSDAFKQFATYCGFTHRRITPRWPKANSQAEAFNKPLMKIVRAAHVEGENWKQELLKFLRQYRATPHTVSGFTPYRLMFQREPNTKLPKVYENSSEPKVDEVVRQRDERSKSESKSYSDTRHNAVKYNINVGDKVLLENENKTKLSPKYIPSPYTVKGKKGAMITAENENHEVTRNSSRFKKVRSGLNYNQTNDNKITEDELVNENPPEMQPTNPKYPLKSIHQHQQILRSAKDPRESDANLHI
ncbi:uncharacterized protein K02A2.6-like [Mya arenaria]|uniref:uncharacterized protein K02A2.6-like n=1 Tax=Mya arenaria TaxID=6604 RepID=UPI0022E7368F|nr:uncharacterized protein K02A2.6-like [Mya arenaria]